MASRAGCRPVGSDGSDFRHRERVAPQYNQGPVLKRRLKFVYSLHFLIWVLIFIRMIPDFCRYFGIRTKPYIKKWPFPHADYWEYFWCLGSIVPAIVGFISLNRNKVLLMQTSLIGLLIFGFGPVLVGCFQKAYDIIDFYYTKRARHKFYGFPLIVMIYIFFSLCVQIHGFCLYFGMKLLSLWALSLKKNR